MNGYGIIFSLEISNRIRDSIGIELKRARNDLLSNRPTEGVCGVIAPMETEKGRYIRRDYSFWGAI